MPKIQLGALCAAALIALSGTAATASEAKPAGVPFCSATVTDNCMQREHHAAGRHHEARHHASWSHTHHRHHKARHHHA